MPMAPSLPPESAAAQSGGIPPQNFLMAAASLHSEGKLSAPVPTGRDPLRKAGGKIKVVK